MVADSNEQKRQHKQNKKKQAGHDPSKGQVDKKNRGPNFPST